MHATKSDQHLRLNTMSALSGQFKRERMRPVTGSFMGNPIAADHNVNLNIELSNGEASKETFDHFTSE